MNTSDIPNNTRYRKHTFASLATRDLKSGDFVGTVTRRVSHVYRIDTPGTNKLAILWEVGDTLTVVDRGYEWYDVERVERLPDEVDLATYYGYGSGPVTVSRKSRARVCVLENRTSKVSGRDQRVKIHVNVEELRQALDDLGF